MGRTTSIGSRDVPIEEGDVPVVYFSAGRLGKSEAGLYQFWTAVSKGRGTTARSRAGTDPGERFRRMGTSAADAEGWAIAADAEFVRPASEKEVLGWLDIKPHDSPFAKWYYAGASKSRVVRTPDGYALQSHSSE